MYFQVTFLNSYSFFRSAITCLWNCFIFLSSYFNLSSLCYSSLFFSSPSIIREWYSWDVNPGIPLSFTAYTTFLDVSHSFPSISNLHLSCILLHSIIFCLSSLPSIFSFLTSSINDNVWFYFSSFLSSTSSSLFSSFSIASSKSSLIYICQWMNSCFQSVTISSNSVLSFDCTSLVAF